MNKVPRFGRLGSQTTSPTPNKLENPCKLAWAEDGGSVTHTPFISGLQWVLALFLRRCVAWPGRTPTLTSRFPPRLMRSSIAGATRFRRFVSSSWGRGFVEMPVGISWEGLPKTAGLHIYIYIDGFLDVFGDTTLHEQGVISIYHVQHSLRNLIRCSR